MRRLAWGCLVAASMVVPACSLGPAGGDPNIAVSFPPRPFLGDNKGFAWTQGLFTLPGSLSGLSCYGVMVNAPDIPPNPMIGGYCNVQVPAGKPFPAVIGGLVSAAAGGMVEVAVPGGSQRLIRVVGYQSSAGCPNVANMFSSGTPAASSFGSAFELAATNRDVYTDTSISLTASLNTSNVAYTCSGNASVQVASIVGQAVATTGTFGCTQSTMGGPSSVTSDGTRLVVADVMNNRVLIWNSLPTSNGQNADVVVGQTGFLGTGTGTTSQFVNGPSSVALYGSKLIVADNGNSRVLIWNTIPSTNGQAADIVLGQSTFTGSTGAVGSTGMNLPEAVAVNDNGELFVADRNNNRVLYYPTIPASSGAAATYAMGQANMIGNANATTQTGMYFPKGVSASTSRVVVGDSQNHRVTIYNIPTAHGQPAIAVLGQTGYTGASPSLTSQGMNTPKGVYLKGNKLYVADSGWNRISYWADVMTVSNYQPHDGVFGQPNSTSGAANNGGESATTLNNPTGVYSDSAGNVYAADQNNYRVTINSWF